MPRRPSELSNRRTHVAPRKPKTPGRKEAFVRGGVPLRPLAGLDIPIPPEQEEALLARYEAWKGQYNGSLPEFLVFEFLTVDKKQKPNVDFIFQHPLFGGRTRFGGFILDFYFPMRKEGWRVMGERYHLEQPADRARDALAAVQLMAEGMRVIDLWEDDLLSRREFVLNLAWEQSAAVISRAPFGFGSV